MRGITKRAFFGWVVAVAIGSQAGVVLAADYETLAMSVDEMKATGALIVDIRTPEEWAETGVIDGAKLVTFTDPEGFLAAVGPELGADRPLVLICHSGRRSAAAAEALQGQIPNRIISAEGGMSAVIAAGYAVVAPE